MSGWGDDFASLLDGAAEHLGDFLGLGESQAPSLAGSAWDRYAQRGGGMLDGLRGQAVDLFSGVGRGGADLLSNTSAASPNLWDGDRFGIGNAFSSFQQRLAAPKESPANGPGTAVQTGPLYSGGAGGGATGIAGDETWARIDQYSGLIDQAASAVGNGFDGDVFRAIMYNESHGVPTARHAGSGASGLLQLLPEYFQAGENPFDPADNLKAATRLMREKRAQVEAAYAANGLNPDARTRALDLALAWAGHFNYTTGRLNTGSMDNYVNQSAEGLASVFLKNYDALKAARQQQRASQPQGAGYSGGGGMSSMWGGVQAPITQEIGPTDFSNGNPIYGYGEEYGVSGHTGLDVGLKRGSKLYMPVGFTGTVENAGGTPYFRDEDYGDGGTPGKGELRIRLDNGWILILGHTSAINVRAGQRVSGGELVGLSGSANGDHLHLELRIPDASTRSGYRIVDPRQYFR